MCDTLCVVQPDRTLFAKNSDRPVAEAQVVEAWGRRPAGGTLATTHLTIDDAGAHAVLGSRPTWMWGFEHGVNEHGVAVGNEEVWSVVDMAGEPPGLIGMDLVRLALERADTASAAVEVIGDLLGRHGQGGLANAEHQEAYSSSFLVADGREAWVLETAGRTWAARPAGAGTAISNRISLKTDWTVASSDVAPGSDFDRWRDPAMWTGHADARLAATLAAVDRGPRATPASMVATLRDHGSGPWGAPTEIPDRASAGGAALPIEPPPAGPGFDPDSGEGFSVCLHLRDYQATTAALVAALVVDGAPRVWVALGNPCASIFVPVVDLAVPPAALADPATAARFAALARSVEQAGTGPGRLAAIRAALGPVEAELWARADDGAREVDWSVVERALESLGV
jgi:secernin